MQWQNAGFQYFHLNQFRGRLPKFVPECLVSGNMLVTQIVTVHANYLSCQLPEVRESEAGLRFPNYKALVATGNAFAAGVLLCARGIYTLCVRVCKYERYILWTQSNH